MIGAGPAGLAVSIGLAQRGYSVQCFEKLDDPRQDTPELAYGMRTRWIIFLRLLEVKKGEERNIYFFIGKLVLEDQEVGRGSVFLSWLITGHQELSNLPLHQHVRMLLRCLPLLIAGLVCDEARAGNALRLLGFSTEEIKEHGVTIPRGTGCSINPPGGTVRRFGASIDQMQERNPCLYFPRQSLLCLLMEKLQQYDNAQLFCGVSVECKLRDGKTQAPVVTWLGDQGKSQITPHLLVGADGINSVVRSALQEHPSYDFSIERYFAWSQLNSFKAFRVESKKLIHPSLPNSEIVQPESLVGIFSTIEDPSDKRKFRFVCLPESEDGIRRIVPDGVGSDLLSEMQSVDDVYQLLKDNFPFLNVDDTFERTEVERIINGRRGIKPQPACPNSLAAIFDQEGSAAVLIGDSAHQVCPTAAINPAPSLMLPSQANHRIYFKCFLSITHRRHHPI